MTSSLASPQRRPTTPRLAPGGGSVRRGPGPVLVGVLALVVVVVGAYLGWRVAVGGADRHQVVVLGDSITAQADAPLHERFDPSYAMAVSGVSGARADERVADGAAYAATTPGQVIINLGTNDVLQGTPTDETAASLTTLGEGFAGARCIHLVTVNEHMVDLSRPQLHDEAVAVNERIRAIAAQHSWDVVDWAAIVTAADQAGNPDGPLTMDTVHPTPLGQQRLLDAYALALDRC